MAIQGSTNSARAVRCRHVKLISDNGCGSGLDPVCATAKVARRGIAPPVLESVPSAVSAPAGTTVLFFESTVSTPFLAMPSLASQSKEARSRSTDPTRGLLRRQATGMKGMHGICVWRVRGGDVRCITCSLPRSQSRDRRSCAAAIRHYWLPQPRN